MFLFILGVIVGALIACTATGVAAYRMFIRRGMGL